jgi:hypothetical protein
VAPAQPVVVVAASATATVACAMRTDGIICCWDTDVCHPLRSRRGGGDIDVHEIGPRDLRAVELAVGESLSCARTGGGALYCWNDEKARNESLDATRLEVPEPAIAMRLVPAFSEGPYWNGGEDTPSRVFARLRGGRIVEWSSFDGTTTATEGRSTTLKDIPVVAGWGDSRCEQDPKGRVRCRGSGEQRNMRAGLSPRTPQNISDHDWRAVPSLMGARDLGASSFCAWGFVGEMVREDCVYGPGADDQVACRDPGRRCTGWTKSSYVSRGIVYQRESREYRFPRIKRLVTFDVGLDMDGHAYHFDGRTLSPTGGVTFLDIVGDKEHFTGLTTGGEVRQFCTEFLGDDYAVVSTSSVGRP